MSETKHTPGPWIYYVDAPTTEPDWHVVTTANKMRVIANVHIEPGNATDAANARLIAAAPELLAAARALVAYINSMPTDNEKCRVLSTALNNSAGQALKDAIAKATA